MGKLAGSDRQLVVAWAPRPGTGPRGNLPPRVHPLRPSYGLPSQPGQSGGGGDAAAGLTLPFPSLMPVHARSGGGVTWLHELRLRANCRLAIKLLSEFRGGLDPPRGKSARDAPTSPGKLRAGVNVPQSGGGVGRGSSPTGRDSPQSGSKKTRSSKPPLLSFSRKPLKALIPGPVRGESLTILVVSQPTPV